MHATDLEPYVVANGLKWYFICEMLYLPVSSLVRTSIALFLLQLSPPRNLRITVYTVITSVWILFVVTLFILVFQCSPPAFLWEQILGADGSCWQSGIIPSITVTHSVISSVIDFLLALLPVALVRKVKLSLRTKAMVVGILGLGVSYDDSLLKIARRS